MYVKNLSLDKFNENKLKMEINSNSKAFQLLSSGLYKEKYCAIVRELVSNAIDACRMANIDTPVILNIPSNVNGEFYVQDFGIGMDISSVFDVFAVYFNSTKENIGSQIGGFGLGGKTPFIYTDEFKVETTSPLDGIRRTFIFNNASGFPVYNYIDDLDQEDSKIKGTKISFLIKSSDDIHKFIYASKQMAFSYYPIDLRYMTDFSFENVLNSINLNKENLIGYHENLKKYGIVEIKKENEINILKSNGKFIFNDNKYINLNILCGDIIYNYSLEVNNDKLIHKLEQYQKIRDFLHSLETPNQLHIKFCNFYYILNSPVNGNIELTISREEIANTLENNYFISNLLFNSIDNLIKYNVEYYLNKLEDYFQLENLNPIVYLYSVSFLLESLKKIEIKQYDNINIEFNRIIDFLKNKINYIYSLFNGNNFEFISPIIYNNCFLNIDEFKTLDNTKKNNLDKNKHNLEDKIKRINQTNINEIFSLNDYQYFTDGIIFQHNSLTDNISKFSYYFNLIRSIFFIPVDNLEILNSSYNCKRIYNYIKKNVFDNSFSSKPFVIFYKAKDNDELNLYRSFYLNEYLSADIILNNLESLKVKSLSINNKKHEEKYKIHYGSCSNLLNGTKRSYDYFANGNFIQDNPYYLYIPETLNLNKSETTTINNLLMRYFYKNSKPKVSNLLFNYLISYLRDINSEIVVLDNSVYEKLILNGKIEKTIIEQVYKKYKNYYIYAMGIINNIPNFLILDNENYKNILLNMTRKDLFYFDGYKYLNDEYQEKFIEYYFNNNIKNSLIDYVKPILTLNDDLYVDIGETINTSNNFSLDHLKTININILKNFFILNNYKDNIMNKENTLNLNLEQKYNLINKIFCDKYEKTIKLNKCFNIVFTLNSYINEIIFNFNNSLLKSSRTSEQMEYMIKFLNEIDS